MYYVVRRRRTCNTKGATVRSTPHPVVRHSSIQPTSCTHDGDRLHVGHILVVIGDSVALASLPDHQVSGPSRRRANCCAVLIRCMEDSTSRRLAYKQTQLPCAGVQSVSSIRLCGLRGRRFHAFTHVRTCTDTHASYALESEGRIGSNTHERNNGQQHTHHISDSPSLRTAPPSLTSPAFSHSMASLHSEMPPAPNTALVLASTAASGLHSQLHLYNAPLHHNNAHQHCFETPCNGVGGLSERHERGFFVVVPRRGRGFRLSSAVSRQRQTIPSAAPL